jgi:phosphopantetheine binding protein
MEPCRPPLPDAGGLVRTAVVKALNLEPEDYDPARSLAEMGCDSLNVIDIQYELEKELGVRDLGLGAAPDFDPLRDPVGRLEDYVRSLLAGR